MRDARSGLRITRLTHSPCISHNLYFEMCSFTADDGFVVFSGQRSACRDAPWDLFRATTDGSELVQLTEYDDLGGIVVSPATGHVLYQAQGELHRMNIVSMAEETVAETPGRLPTRVGSLASVDAAGATYFGNCRIDEDRAPIFRADLGTGRLEVIYESKEQCHLHAEPSGASLCFGDWVEGVGIPYRIDADGSNLRPFRYNQFAHWTWFGDPAVCQGTLLPPGNAIVLYDERTDEVTPLAEGRYYWHSGPSRDGQWIVSDTNWPQEGLFLLHVPSKTVTYVCDPKSSCSHPQWTHPHPSLSPNMKYVLFNSDVTGIGQIYLAELTEEFLEKAAAGYDCKPQEF